jgi:ubiquinone/menaquinone biosynthesis C-methylase UbiE
MTTVTLTREPGEPVFPAYRPFPNETGRNWRQEHLEIPAMVALLGLESGGRVLEVGCGRGVALPVVARRLRPVRLVGLDIDEALLAVARAQAATAESAIELRNGDVRALPFADASFDLVIDFGTSYHVDRPGRALREIARVLRAGGVFATETRLSQWLSHPGRSAGRYLPWWVVPELAPHRRALLWEARRKVDGSGAGAVG